MAYTLNDYLKQKAAGQAVVGFSSSTPASSVAKKPLAPRLTAPSFSVATLPPAMPAIATWDDVRHAALPVALTLPRLPDPSLPLAPKLPNLAETTPRFSASPTIDYVTRTSAPPQPEKPSFWERSSAFANAPTAPSIWDRASTPKQPGAPGPTTAQPQFGSWSDARASGAARVNPFAAPSFTGAPVTPTTSVNLPGTAATAWGSAPAGSATPRYTPRLPEHSFASFAPAAPFNATTAFARQPSSAQPTPGLSGPTPTTTTSLTGRYTPLSNDKPFAFVAGGTPTSLGSGSSSAARSAGLSPAGQSIIDDINRIMRDNNIGDFDRLGIRLNSLSEGIESGLDDNIAQARFERVVEDAVAEGAIVTLGGSGLFETPVPGRDDVWTYEALRPEEAAPAQLDGDAQLRADEWWAETAASDDPPLGNAYLGQQGRHHYEANSIICHIRAGCTPSQVFEALKLIAAPGQTGPAFTGNEVPVRLGPVFFGNVKQRVYDDALAVTNFTIPSEHGLDPGYVTRQVVVENGFVIVRTIGEGVGPNGTLNGIAGPVFWPTLVDPSIRSYLSSLGLRLF